MKLTLIMIALFIAIQAIRPEKTNPPVDTTLPLHAPQEIEAILKRACYDCHSHETTWPWYANIAPLSWSIVSHVNDGRKALNFSEWKKIPKEIKVKRLKRMTQTTRNGMMPLSSYLLLHKDATLTKEEKERISKWVDKKLEELK